MDTYILSFDQSTSTTKALLFNQNGKLIAKSNRSHQQIISPQGWVEHDGQQIVENLFAVAKDLLEQSQIEQTRIVGIALSNQRETTIAWDRTTGKPLYNAIVWQCGRAQKICDELTMHKQFIHNQTGLHLSPYFSAAKMAWLLQNIESVKQHRENKTLVLSTMDSFLLYHLTEEKIIKTEPSNASRTQLMSLLTASWNEEVANLFSIPLNTLPQICNSNALFGHTSLGGLLDNPVPIQGVLGDSQGALYAQGCFEPGMVKTTYGTGSSVMMNTGTQAILSKDLVTSVGWSLNNEHIFVLEGNINYSGAIISYLVDDLGLLSNVKEVELLAKQAKDIEGLYFVPAFSGLGSPYWDANARALIVGIDRRCSKAEIARAAEQAIAYQIADIIFLMNDQTKEPIVSMHVDGGASRDTYLMQFQANLLQCEIKVAHIEELSGLGPALLCANTLGVLNTKRLRNNSTHQQTYVPNIDSAQRDKLYEGWRSAIAKTLTI